MAEHRHIEEDKDLCVRAQDYGFLYREEVNFIRGSLISSMTLSLYFYIFYGECQASSKGFIGRIGVYIGFIG